MKISTFVQLFLIIAIFMIVFGMISKEAQTYYPEANIDDSEWYGKYNYAEEINDSTYDIQVALHNIGEKDKGWFGTILSGVAAIPKTVIGLVSLVFKSFWLGGKIITGTLTTLLVGGTGEDNTTTMIIWIIIAAIMIWGIFKLLDYYHKPSTPI